MHEEHEDKLRYVEANSGWQFSQWKVTRRGNIWSSLLCSL